MTTKHKLVAFLPMGDPDLGCEIECEIAFTFLPGGKPTRDDPGSAAEIDLISAAPLSNGKPSPFEGVFADMEQGSLDDLARWWLESVEGQAAAMAEVLAELEDARAFIAELRRES